MYLACFVVETEIAGYPYRPTRSKVNTIEASGGQYDQPDSLTTNKGRDYEQGHQTQEARLTEPNRGRCNGTARGRGGTRPSDHGSRRGQRGSLRHQRMLHHERVRPRRGRSTMKVRPAKMKSKTDITGVSERQVFLIVDSLKDRIWHREESNLQLSHEDKKEIAELKAMIMVLEKQTR